MKEYRVYTCDFGHSWSFIKEQDEPELPSEVFCSWGHEAITCSRQKFVDDVQIVFRPAGRIVDPVREQVFERGKYFLLVIDADGNKTLTSRKSYSWTEVCSLGQRFEKRSFDWAKKYWERNNF